LGTDFSLRPGRAFPVERSSFPAFGVAYLLSHSLMVLYTAFAITETTQEKKERKITQYHIRAIACSIPDSSRFFIKSEKALDSILDPRWRPADRAELLFDFYDFRGDDFHVAGWYARMIVKNINDITRKLRVSGLNEYASSLLQF
jgi:hypothetical protein